MGQSGRFTHVIVILMFGTGYMQVLYLGRAPRTKETLPDFREKYRVTRHSRVFRELTDSQRTLGFEASQQILVVLCLFSSCFSFSPVLLFFKPLTLEFSR